MDQAFWQERWHQGEIGFNEGKPNALLAKYAEKLGRPPKHTLVPLSGKAFDLRWLADKGHDVVGVEFVGEAIQAFFKEWGVKPTPHRLGAHDAFYANGVTLVEGDIFAITPESIHPFDLIYDRAALVALAPTNRARYVTNMRKLLKPGGGVFLVAFSYDQSKLDGPPWSVDEATVRALYQGMRVELLEQRASAANSRMQASGLPEITESAYWIS